MKRGTTAGTEAAPAPDASSEAPGSNAFAALGLSAEFCRAVADAGYETPTPIQREAIPLILSGRDIMGLAQTGTGKTAAFTLPIADRLLRGPHRLRALVLTPTRELCQQVERSFTGYARHTTLVVTSIYGGVGMEPQERALRKGVDVIVATPGRLIDHHERGNVSFDLLETLVLDEADRMLDMGFAPQINRIVSAIPAYRQTLLFSATMPPRSRCWRASTCGGRRSSRSRAGRCPPRRSGTPCTRCRGAGRARCWSSSCVIPAWSRSWSSRA